MQSSGKIGARQRRREAGDEEDTELVLIIGWASSGCRMEPAASAWWAAQAWREGSIGVEVSGTLDTRAVLVNCSGLNEYTLCTRHRPKL